MNNQCEFCIHNSVCAYKEHYEDAVKLYEKSREEYEKYPWIKIKIECTQYREKNYFNLSIQKKRNIEDGNDK